MQDPKNVIFRVAVALVAMSPEVSVSKFRCSSKRLKLLRKVYIKTLEIDTTETTIDSDTTDIIAMYQRFLFT